MRTSFFFKKTQKNVRTVKTFLNLEKPENLET